MPYYHCEGCQLTVYGGNGHAAAPVCPNCDRDLRGAPREFVRDASHHEFHRHLVREPQAAAAARRELKALGQLGQAELSVTSLLTTELINNSVQHAGAGAGTLLSLDVFVSDAVVRVAVSDRGPGLVAARRPSGRPSDVCWGRQLVEGLASRWTLGTDRGNVVSFELDRDARENGRQPRPRRLSSRPERRVRPAGK